MLGNRGQVTQRKCGRPKRFDQQKCGFEMVWKDDEFGCLPNMSDMFQFWGQSEHETAVKSNKGHKEKQIITRNDP